MKSILQRATQIQWIIPKLCKMIKHTRYGLRSSSGIFGIFYLHAVLAMLCTWSTLSTLTTPFEKTANPLHISAPKRLNCPTLICVLSAHAESSFVLRSIPYSYAQIVLPPLIRIKADSSHRNNLDIANRQPHEKAFVSSLHVDSPRNLRYTKPMAITNDTTNLHSPSYNFQWVRHCL